MTSGFQPIGLITFARETYHHMCKLMNIANNMVLSTSYVIISGIKNYKRLSHGIWLSPDLSTRADNGRCLIKRAINKMSCYNLFITHSNPLFTEIYLKETTDFLSTEVMLEDV